MTNKYINKFFTKIIYIIIFTGLLSCSASNTTFKEFKVENYSDFRTSQVAIIPIYNDFISNDDSKEANQYLHSELKEYYRETIFSKPSENTKKLEDVLIKSDWKNFWKNYKENKKVDKNTLVMLSTILRANTILTIYIKDVINENGSYREEKGYTTVKIIYTLFSTTNGQLLYELETTSTRRNPNSMSKAPKTLGVIKLATRDILGKLPLE